jgi:hypothetical protein
MSGLEASLLLIAGLIVVSLIIGLGVMLLLYILARLGVGD